MSRKDAKSQRKRKQLHKGGEDRRRFKLIDVSRAGDPRYVSQLIALLDGAESTANRRHAVRALGNIGGADVEKKLIAMLTSEQGMILGEIARSLGQIGSKQAIPALGGLANHDLEWVRQNAAWALRRLGAEPS